MIKILIQKSADSSQKAMQNQQELTLALTALAQHILETQEDNSLSLAKMLLTDIDPMFDTMINYSSSFPALKPCLNKYYQTQRQEQINWMEVLQLYQDFALIGLFVLDLALAAGKQSYIESMLALSEEHQVCLQPFVQQVTQRHHFISPRSPQPPQNQEEQINREHLLELSEENDKLKTEKEHLLRAHQEIMENYEDLKVSHEKVSEELQYLKMERFSLINELGGSQCGSVDQTIDRVKKEIQNYEKTVEKQQKQIDEKKVALKTKNDELLRHQESFKVNRYEERMLELQQAQTKIKALEEELQQTRVRQEDERMTVDGLREQLTAREEEGRQLREQVTTHQAYYNKYMSIRKLHNQFKSKIVKNSRQLKE